MIEIAFLIMLLITIILLIIIIRYRKRIKFLRKLIKNPSLLDAYESYAKSLKKSQKPLTDDEKRKAFAKAYININEALIVRTKERITKEMEK